MTHPDAKAQLAATKKIASGIGILLVVICHLSGVVPPDPNAPAYPYMFHMPLFFFIAGIGMQPERGWWPTTRYMVIHYLGYVLLFWGIYSAIGRVFFTETMPRLAPPPDLSWLDLFFNILRDNMHQAPLFLTGWFLIALCIAKLAAFAITKLLNQSWISARTQRGLLWCIAFVLVAGGMVLLAPAYHAAPIWWKNLGTQVSVAAGFILLGMLAEPWLLRASALLNRAPVLHSLGLGAGALVAALVIARGYHPLSMAWSSYPQPWWDMVFALFGTGYCLLLSHSLIGHWAGRWMGLLGVESKAIMTHHLFGFALINALLVALGAWPDSKVLDVFACWQPHWSWPFYTGFAIGLSLLIARSTHAVKKRFTR